jgi:hypothetical protein
MYISSFGTNTVERYQEVRYAPAPADGQTGATFVAPNSGGVNHPLGVVIGPRDHDLYVTSLETNEVLRYHGTMGEFLGAFVQADEGLHAPAGILFGPDGNLYVSNAQPDVSNVMRFDGHTGAFIDVFAQLDTMGGATGMVFGPEGLLYVGTRFSNGVVRCDGTTCTQFIAEGSGGLSRTGGFTFGPDGNFYVASEDTNNILRFDGTTGEFIDEFVHESSGGLSRPAGILFGPFGDLYVGSIGTNSILHYDGQTGAFLNAIITRHDDQIISGPRQFFFSETSPTTLQYQRRHRGGFAADPSDPSVAQVESAAAVAPSIAPSTPAFIASVDNVATDPSVPFVSTLGNTPVRQGDLAGSSVSSLVARSEAQQRDMLFSSSDATLEWSDPLAQ